MKTATSSKPILIVAGTRPESIKLAPVYFCARKRFGEERILWVSTGQHQQLERDTLEGLGIRAAYRLEAGGADGSLLKLNENVIRGLSKLQHATETAMVVVQGDTISAFSAAFAAFHGRVPLAHVEAGLRSFDNQNPFPEEAYRRMIDTLASIHFAPTPTAAANLKAEGCQKDSIYVTGNTAVDALMLAEKLSAALPAELPRIAPGHRMLFVTLHRRESWGDQLKAMCLALIDLVERFEDLEIVLPVHINPRVRKDVTALLEGHPRIILLPPLDFAACHAVMREAQLILTDSGGIQEEAPSYGVPVLVLRRVTERPEAVAAGMAIVTGTDRGAIVAAASRLLEDDELRAAMQRHHNPVGDGQAAMRIVTAIERFLRGEQPLLTEEEQFAVDRLP